MTNQMLPQYLSQTKIILIWKKLNGEGIPREQYCKLKLMGGFLSKLLK